VSAVEFIFQRIPGQLRQRLGAPRQPLQLAIRHAGVVGRQAAALGGVVKVGLVRTRHPASILRVSREGQLGKSGHLEPAKIETAKTC
jgi:hypothetical protein